MRRSTYVLAFIGAALVAGLVWAASVYTAHNVTGGGSAPPTATWYPPATDFGFVEVGGPPAVRTVRLKNTGKAGNLVGTIALSTECPPGVFGITAGGGAYTLGPGQSRNVTIAFAPNDTSRTWQCLLTCGP